MPIVSVCDETTKFIGHRFLNSQICLSIGLLQLFICFLGLAQHIRSLTVDGKVLRCDFENGSLPLEAADAVIFDIGLFTVLWDLRGCVAEYIDGGTGRFCWCVSHVLSLSFSLPWAFVRRPKPYVLWPLLVQQSLYGICLFILLLSALPKILPLLAEPHAAPLPALAVYLTGTSLNFFLLYLLWRWYWFVEGLWNSAVRVRFGEVRRNANNRTRRDKPMTFPQPAAPSFAPPEVPDDPEEPIPIIVATRVAPDDIENIALRAQETRVNRKRRRLPATPQDPPKLIFPPDRRLRRSRL